MAKQIVALARWNEMEREVAAFAKNTSEFLLPSFRSQHTKKGPYKGSPFQSWNNESMRVHSPPLHKRTVHNTLFGGCSRLIVPVRKDKAWLWTFGEIRPH